MAGVGRKNRGSYLRVRMLGSDVGVVGGRLGRVSGVEGE